MSETLKMLDMNRNCPVLDVQYPSPNFLCFQFDTEIRNSSLGFQINSLSVRTLGIRKRIRIFSILIWKSDKFQSYNFETFFLEHSALKIQNQKRNKHSNQSFFFFVVYFCELELEMLFIISIFIGVYQN
ncbi:hypothetical protein C1645_739135 [Glomus cerebriforme]|uniref:Uncharacterized protein n=1 Tax=Glomus cerebriforme TaxID=658196 RepID=A0A397SSV2_9GLOM|nr:hypothetical protein C1645_739135 [Glomus cerebriforme]